MPTKKLDKNLALKCALNDMFNLEEARKELGKRFPVGSCNCEDAYKLFGEFEDKVWDNARKALAMNGINR